MKAIAIIPARYASSRFPGKPLALLGGRPIIQWVWESVRNIDELSDVIVATDDSRIVDAVRQFGGKALMTSDSHRSGTDRCGEVVTLQEEAGKHYDVVVNIQGDEPFTQPNQIRSLISAFSDPDTHIATLRKPIRSVEELTSPNNVKVITDNNDNAIYFSRFPIPYLRGFNTTEWLQHQTYFKHVGIYAFRSNILKDIIRLNPSFLERSESLEQLRWLEHGFKIKLCDTDMENIGIDTPEDLVAAENSIASKQMNS